MYTGNYDFTSVIAVKIIVQNGKGEVLLIQEPETNNWMPLHWGFPGGKPTEKESLQETFYRKVASDLGQKIEPEGILKIEELLMEGRTVMMYILLAKAPSDSIKGEIRAFKWVNRKMVEDMKIEDFTEYYNKELLLSYFDNKLNLVPLDLFKSWNYFGMGNDESYTKWLDSGKIK